MVSIYKNPAKKNKKPTLSSIINNITKTNDEINNEKKPLGIQHKKTALKQNNVNNKNFKPPLKQNKVKFDLSSE